MIIIKIFVIIFCIFYFIYVKKIREKVGKYFYRILIYDYDKPHHIYNLIDDTVSRIICLVIIVITIMDLCGYINIYPIGSIKTNYEEIKVGISIDSIPEKYKRNEWVEYSNIKIYEVNNEFLVITLDRDVIQSVGVISRDRIWKYESELQLVNFDYSVDYDGLFFSNIEKKYGSVWINIGDTEFTPSYITTDGSIIYFEVHDDIIAKVYEIDIVSNYKARMM